MLFHWRVFDHCLIGFWLQDAMGMGKVALGTLQEFLASYPWDELGIRAQL